MAHGPPTPGSAERSEVQSARWCEQGRAPAFKASSPISNHAPTDRSERQRSTDMAEAADNENRGLPERQRMEPRLQVGSRHLGLLDSVADRQPATRSCHCRQRGTGVPDSGCLAQRAHRAEPFLMTSKVLGSSSWLFVPVLAGQTAARRESSHRVQARDQAPERVRRRLRLHAQAPMAGRGLRAEPATTGAGEMLPD